MPRRLVILPLPSFVASHPELRFGFLLHDIGKIGIPDSILLKPDRLDAGELRTL